MPAKWFLSGKINVYCLSKLIRKVRIFSDVFCASRLSVSLLILQKVLVQYSQTWGNMSSWHWKRHLTWPYWSRVIHTISSLYWEVEVYCSAKLNSVVPKRTQQSKTPGVFMCGGNTSTPQHNTTQQKRRGPHSGDIVHLYSTTALSVVFILSHQNVYLNCLISYLFGDYHCYEHYIYLA